MTNSTSTTTDTPVITSQAFLHNWQAHRGLSRRVLAAFPEKELFEFSIGGMRPYNELVIEMAGLASAGMNGIVTGKWETTPALDHFNKEVNMATKAELLDAWDKVTEQIDTLWPQIPAGFLKQKPLSGNIQTLSLTHCNTFLTTRYTTAGRGTFTCAPWALNHLHFGTGFKNNKPL